MAMNHQRTPRLKRLLDKVPPGFMVDTGWLKGQEVIDPKSIHEYVERGWLERDVPAGHSVVFYRLETLELTGPPRDYSWAPWDPPRHHAPTSAHLGH